MMSLTDDQHAYIIQGFNYTSRCLDDIKANIIHFLTIY